MFSLKVFWDRSNLFRWNMKIAFSGSIPAFLGLVGHFLDPLFVPPMERGTQMEQPGTLEVVQRSIVREQHKKSHIVEVRPTISSRGKRSRRGKWNDPLHDLFWTLPLGVLHPSV